MVRLISNRSYWFTIKNIPALCFAGMFFFCSQADADLLALATGLFEEGEWALCRRECRRALLQDAKPAERFRLLGTLALVRDGGDPEACAAQLASIAGGNADTETTAVASYELGRLQWLLNQPERALDSFAQAFHTTTNKTLFLRAACSIFLLAKEFPDIQDGREGLMQQVATSRNQWYGALFKMCAKPDPSRREPGAPNWIVRFYRSQISPAIGNRCTLEPSCSEYFHQAHQHHGWVAVPMAADRFFREPEVSNRKDDPVVMESGQIRYRDPVENHDFWMEKK